MNTHLRYVRRLVATAAVALPSLVAPPAMAAQDVAGAEVPDDAAEMPNGPPEGLGGPAPLRFDWPAGLTAEVDYRQLKVERKGIGRDTLTMEGSYRMSTGQHPRGMRVRMETVEPIALVDTNADREVLLQDLVARLEMIPMSYVVAGDGTLVEVEGMNRVRTEMVEAFDPLVRELGAAGPEFRRFLDQFLTEETLVAFVEEYWNAIVGLWVDAELELGETYAIEEAGPLPVFPDHAVLYRSEFSSLGRVDCRTGETALAGGCVRLHATSRPDSASLASAIAEILPPLVVDGRPTGPRMQMKVDSYVDLDAEPDGLIPHRVEIGSSIDVTGGPTGSASATDVTRYVYRYGDGAGD